MSGKTTAGTTVQESTDKQEQAVRFVNSLRGNLILSQALHYGIQELNRVPVPYREVSNLDDMQYLRDTLFNFPVETNDIAIAMAKEEGLIE